MMKLSRKDYSKLKLYTTIKQYCKKNGGVLQFATYGGAYGTYTAFTIEDKEIREACAEALSKNENYINNVCRW